MAQQLAESNGTELARESDAAALALVPESGTRGRQPARFRVGDLIENRYRVFGTAATGGMGVVYVCEDTLLGRLVAIKLMRSENDPAQRLAERFFAEARITAQLKNPHVVDLFDCAALNTGEPFMVMEFVDGSDLFSVLRAEGRMPEEKVVRYMLQVCEGLRAVHARGIVHCDLKPENLVVSRTAERGEVVKIVDFGVAKQKGVPSLFTLASPDVVCGSPNYMSPEQIRTLTDVDARSDVWALGVVMFELLTGRPPFVGSDENRICDSVLHDPTPSAASLGVHVSAELEAVIARCLEKAPDERFPNVDELVLALAAVVLRREGAKHAAPDCDSSVARIEASLEEVAPEDERAVAVVQAPPSHRRHLGHGIAAMIVLSILLWGRSDTSPNATLLERARATATH